MGETEATRQYHFETPPRAGFLASLAVTNAAASQDLRLIGNQTGNMAQTNQALPTGLPGHRVELFADGGDVYVIFGPTAASVSAGNAPVIATNGVNVAGVCMKIPTGTRVKYKLEPSPQGPNAPAIPTTGDNFVGYITTATAQLRIAQVSI
jgi:hypothetical protein